LTRTALALGWDAVALLPGTCDPFNDKVMARILIARFGAPGPHEFLPSRG